MSKRKLEATRANQLRKSGARVPPGARLPRQKQEQRTRLALYALGIAGFLGLAIAIFLVSRGSSSGSPKANFSWAALPGLQTDAPPWTQGLEQFETRLDAIGFKALPKETLNYHIHAHLDTYVNGKKYKVPAQIGIDPFNGLITTLHTHADNGTLHVEAPSKRDYTLGEMFGVWGVKLTPSCVGIYCNSGDKQLRVYVNGKQIADPFHLVLKSHDEIALTYGTKAQLPKPIPSRFTFQAGE
jgi:hypothetical protein